MEIDDIIIDNNVVMEEINIPCKEEKDTHIVFKISSIEVRIYPDDTCNRFDLGKVTKRKKKDINTFYSTVDMIAYGLTLEKVFKEIHGLILKSKLDINIKTTLQEFFNIYKECTKELKEVFDEQIRSV